MNDDSLSTTARKAQNIAGEFRAEAQDAAGELRDEAEATAGQVRDKAQEAAGQFREQAQQVAGQVRDHAQRAFAESDDYVRENPWTVVLGAAGIGLLVGFALAQRHEPTLRERYVDEPLEGARDLLYSILSPVASRVQKEYGNARSSIEEAAERLKEVDASKQANRLGRKLRFW